MYCDHCGKKLVAGEKYCSECGNPVIDNRNEPEVKTVRFICKGCHSVMEIKADSGTVKCPNCGSTEIIVESDDIKKERIRSYTILEKQKIEKEIKSEIEAGITERARLANDLELEKTKLLESRKDVRRKKRFRGIKIVAIIISCLIIALIVGGVISGINDKKKRDNYVWIPSNAEDYTGLDYNTVKSLLADVGFINIELRPLGDCEKDSQENGEVSRVTIAGSWDFTKSHRFNKDDKVSIYYHSIDLEDSTDNN